MKTPEYNFETVKTAVEEIAEEVAKMEEKRLLRVSMEYDLFVSNPEIKHQMEEMLPEGTKVWVSGAIEPNTVIIIKKAAIDPYLGIQGGSSHDSDSGL